MFLIPSVRGRRPREQFVESAEVREPLPGWVRPALWIFWALVVIKSVVVAWLVEKYAMPIGSWLVIVPTVLFGLLATVLILRRRV